MTELPNLADALLTPLDLSRLEQRGRAQRAPRVLLLRERSFCRLFTAEAERLLRDLGAETRVLYPRRSPLPGSEPADLDLARCNAGPHACMVRLRPSRRRRSEAKASGLVPSGPICTKIIRMARRGVPPAL